MKKAVYRLILFVAFTAFVLSLSPSVKAEPNGTQTKQNQCIASDTKPLSNADKQEQAPHQKSAVSKENSQLQLAKEQLRGDFYKDSADSLKWALRLIFTFFVAFVAYALFKNTKEYRQALADAKEAVRDAKEAAKSAHDLEKEAQQVLADIKKQAKTTVEEIEKTSKKQREESSSEFDRQRKISELFSKGLKAGEAKDHETATDCYRQIVEDLKEEDEVAYNNWGYELTKLAESKKGKEAEDLFNQAIEKSKKAIEINPDHSTAYNNWGWTLSRIAKLKKGKYAEDLFNQAIEKCKKAIEIIPNINEAYTNWGFALSGIAKLKKGKYAEDLFNQAIEKFKKSIEIKPNNDRAYHHWGYALSGIAKLKKGKDAEDLLKQAEEKYLKAESIKTGESAYNLACVYARRGNEENCKEWFKVGEKAGTLPSREHAIADDDLKSVRNKAWFKQIRWKTE